MYIQSISRWVVATILVVGSLTKLWNFQWFAGVLAKYRLTPRGTNNVVGFLVLSFELIVGIALVAGRWLPWSAYFAAGIFLVFTIAISITLARGKFDIPCGCNGFWKKTRIGWHLIFRNLGLTGLALLSRETGSLRFGRVYPWIFVLSLGLLALSFSPKSLCTHELRSRSNYPIQIQ